jgi:hypothetical protein
LFALDVPPSLLLVEQVLVTLSQNQSWKRSFCPNTGEKVQAWAEDDPEEDDLSYVQVTCLAWAQAHLVNPKSGKVLGSDE